MCNIRANPEQKAETEIARRNNIPNSSRKLGRKATYT